MSTTGSPTRAHLVSIAVAIATAIVIAFPPSASGAVTRELRPNDDPTNTLRTSPPRMEFDVVPGQRRVERISILNDSANAQDITVSSSDFGATDDPKSIGVQVEDGEFGAGDWISPEVSELRLAPFEKVTFDVAIDPPIDAPSGTNLGAVLVRGLPASGVIGASDNEGALVVDALVQVFLTVPGPVQHDLRIIDIDTRDTFNFGSSRVTTWDVTFRNDGTVNEHVEGSVDVQSLFGTSADRIKIDPLLVLRGSTRTIRVVWRDVPWVGAFTPKVMVRGDDARLQTKTGDRLVVLPWWVIPAILLAIVLPLGWIWLQRRRDWKLYLEDENDDVDPYDDPWDPAEPTHH